MPLLFIFSFFIVGTVSASLTTDYYQQLIAQETAKSLTYELPKKNEEFKTGYESTAVNGKRNK